MAAIDKVFFSIAILTLIVLPAKASAQGPDSIFIEELIGHICAITKNRTQILNNLSKPKLPGSTIFEVDRGLVKYLSFFPPEVSEKIVSLGPDDRILNLGAGNLVFERELLTAKGDELNPSRSVLSHVDPTIKKLSKHALKERPEVTSVTLEVASGVLDKMPAKVDPIVCKIYSEIPKERLLNGKKKFSVALDLFGVHSYTDTFIQDLSKTLEVLDNDGALYIYAASDASSFTDNRVIDASGKEIGLFDYLKLNKTIDTEFVATPFGDKSIVTIRIRKKNGIKPEFKESLLLVDSYIPFNHDPPAIRKFLVYSGEQEPGFNVRKLNQALKSKDFAKASLNELENDPWFRAAYAAKPKDGLLSAKDRTLKSAKVANRNREKFDISPKNGALNLALLFHDMGWTFAEQRGRAALYSPTRAQTFAEKILRRSGMNLKAVEQVETYLNDRSIFSVVDKGITPEQAFSRMNENAKKLGVSSTQYFKNLQWLETSTQLADQKTAKKIVFDSSGRPVPDSPSFRKLEKLYAASLLTR